MMTEFAAEIVSSGLSVDPAVVGTVDAADEGVVDAGPASHSSSMVAAPEGTALKQ